MGIGLQTANELFYWISLIDWNLSNKNVLSLYVFIVICMTLEEKAYKNTICSYLKQHL